MKNPNGFGSIHKLPGKRRKPWAIQVTVGWTPQGKQLRKYISYHTTRAEAIEFLSNYNNNPYSLDTMNITFSEVYEKWSTQKFDQVSSASVTAYKTAYNNCKELYNIKFIDLRAGNLQEFIDKSGKGHGALRKIKVLFNQLFLYAMKNDIVTKDYSRLIGVGKNEKESIRKPFSTTEIKRLWECVEDIFYADTVLIMIYTGLRAGELLSIKTKNVDLINKTIKGGLKTDAGKNRVVPIHPRIFSLITARLENNTSEYLICNHEYKQMSYNTFRRKFNTVMEQLSFKHTTHDCRHTFATLLNNAEANKTSIKKLVGHSSFSTTEKIYTHKDVEELRKAIELID